MIKFKNRLKELHESLIKARTKCYHIEMDNKDYMFAVTFDKQNGLKLYIDGKDVEKNLDLQKHEITGWKDSLDSDKMKELSEYFNKKYKRVIT